MTTAHPDVTVRSADEVPWDDVRTVFGTRGDPAGCWCQYFKLSNAEWKAVSTEPTNDRCRDALRAQIASASPSPGVVAYLDGKPVGWCAVEPRPHYARLSHSTVVLHGPREQGGGDAAFAESDPHHEAGDGPD